MTPATLVERLRTVGIKNRTGGYVVLTSERWEALMDVVAAAQQTCEDPEHSLVSGGKSWVGEDQIKRLRAALSRLAQAVGETP